MVDGPFQIGLNEVNVSDKRSESGGLHRREEGKTGRKLLSNEKLRPH